MKKTKTILITILTILAMIQIAYAITVNGISSSYTFNVENCTSDYIGTLGCNSTTIRFECDIIDPQFINYATFRINNIEYSTYQNVTNPEQFYLYYNKPTETSNTQPLSLEREQITDVDENLVNAYYPVTIARYCNNPTCNANITNTPITNCDVNNTYILGHISSNETCLSSYNTTENCNYCNPNIIANYTTCDNNGTRNVNYYDNNYTTCCLATGLNEDCIINNPQYNPATENCNYYTNQFTCTLDEQPIIDDKININCEMPTDEENCCVVNLYQGINQTNLLQTNPSYKSSTSAFVFSKEQETRTCFTPNNRLLNAYYTNKEIRPDTEYKLEIKCTSNTTTLISQYEITPVYKTPDQIIHRTKWIGDNAVTMIMIIITTIIIIALTIFLISKFRR